MADFPEPSVRVTRYEVSCLPEDNINHRYFKLHVEHRGSGHWIVCQDGLPRLCLGRDGTWEYESAVDDEWIAMRTFDEETALALAREAAPDVTVNGYSVAHFLQRAAARKATDG
jgi:hypothetical protein